MMVIKLVALFVLALAVCGFVESNLDKYGQFGGLDIDGYHKRCFLRLHLVEEAKRYRRELVGPELDSDSMEMWKILAGEEFEKFGNGFGCSQGCYAELLPTLSKQAEFGRQQLYDSKCANWAKLNTLCEQIWTRKQAGEKLLPNIENIFCEAGKTIASDSKKWFHECRDKAKKGGSQMAAESIEKILAYSQEQLDEEKSKIETEIETTDKMISEHDKKTTQQAYADINRIVEEFLPKYKHCLLGEQVKKDAEAAVRKAKWKNRSLFRYGAEKIKAAGRLITDY